MGPIRLAAGAAALAATTALLSLPASAQWNNEPYSFRSGGGAGMSSAYRQAYIDEKLNNNRPRNLVRGADGSLLTVTERDNQAFLSTPQPNYVVNRSGVVAGLDFGSGGFGVRSTVDGWTTMMGASAAPVGRAPIESWVAQLDGLQPVR